MMREIKIYNIISKSGDILGTYFNLEFANREAEAFENVSVVEAIIEIEMNDKEVSK